jgi:hypothetical protein
MAKTITINEPIPFKGTEEQKEANFRTHYFGMGADLDSRCHYCDCKPWHKAAFYPCGEEPPRHNVEYS